MMTTDTDAALVRVDAVFGRAAEDGWLDKPFVFTNCLTGEGIADVATLIRRNVLFTWSRRGNWPDERARRSRTRALSGRAGADAQRAPGKHGVLDIAFARRGDRSVLAHLHRKAPLLVQQALYWDEHLAPPRPGGRRRPRRPGRSIALLGMHAQ